MRVAVLSQIQPAVQAYIFGLRALGHDPVGLLCVRATGRYGFDFGTHLTEAPPELDLVVPASRKRIAPLLRALEPDLALCAGFPWKLPVDALEAPRLGIVNFHPSLLPLYRGPIPVGWAIRNGDREIGVTFHRMAAELDTGPILSQGRLTLGDEWTWDELGPRIASVVQEILPAALERAERGDPGDPQEESDEYWSFFEAEYAEIDWSRPAAEVERQVRAWRFGSSGGDLQGALTELDGERVRVLRVSLEPGGGRPVECGDGTIWVLETEPADGA